MIFYSCFLFTLTQRFSSCVNSLSHFLYLYFTYILFLSVENNLNEDQSSMPVLQPREMNDSDFDKSVAVFDFPDSDEPPPSRVQETTASRRNLSRTKRKRTEPSTNNSKSEKENKLVTSPQDAKKSGTKHNITVCPICRHAFPESADEEARTLHASKCSGLTTKSKKLPNDIPSSSKNTASSSSTVTKKSKMVDEAMGNCAESTGIDSDVCPICSKPFTSKETPADRERHINKCLDSPYDDKDVTMERDEILARSLQLEEDQGPSNSELSVCQICLKDLSKLSVVRQNRHHNACMDKAEMFEGKKNKRTNLTRKVKTTQPKKRAPKIPRKMCPICKAEHPENVRFFFIFPLNYSVWFLCLQQLRQESSLILLFFRVSCLHCS